MTVVDIRQTSPSETPPAPQAPEQTPESPVEVAPAPTHEAPPEPSEPAPEQAPAEPAPAAEPPPPSAPVEPDYRKKFSESAREVQVLLGTFGEMKRVLGEVTNADIPTDEELAAKYPEFPMLSEFEQNTLRRQEITDRKLNKVFVIVDGATTEGERLRAINEFVSSRQELQGREQQFIEFCEKPSHKGAPAETLLSAFLYEESQGQPPATPPAATPPAEPVPPKRGLESGTPGGGTPPSTGPQPISDEELRHLRTTDPKRYNEMVRKGQV